jgi:quercetin dioxygenase-like cupin family protein
MKIVSLQETLPFDPQRVVAGVLLEGGQCTVRLIRLTPGQALPPHTHGQSDLMLYAVEGQGELETETGARPFGAGSLAHYTGAEELRVRNIGQVGLTLLAFLAPPFPPRS